MDTQQLLQLINNVCQLSLKELNQIDASQVVGPFFTAIYPPFLNEFKE
jgi:hypothetical protein